MDVAVLLGVDDHEGRMAPGRQQTTAQNRRQRKREIKCVTWNTRTPYQTGRLENGWREMMRMEIDISGLSEVRWPGVNKVDTDEGCFTY